MSDISNSNKRLHQNFHELCVWIPSLCGHFEVLEVINKKIRGLNATDLEQKRVRSEIIGRGITELKQIIPQLYGVGIISKFSAEFSEISHLLEHLDDCWMTQQITEANVCANNINIILLRVKPYISNAFANLVPRRVTTLEAGLELLGGKTKVVGQKLAKYLPICEKKIIGKPLTQREREDLDGLQDEIPHEWAKLKEALEVYSKASRSWSIEAQQLLIRIHSQHTQFTEAWKNNQTWSELDCQNAQLIYYNFQMAIGEFITQSHEWRVGAGTGGA
jgi:hypothetical protein